MTTGINDNLYNDAVSVVRLGNRASPAFLQRNLKIGYNRACYLLEALESEGVITKANRVGRRKILAEKK